MSPCAKGVGAADGPLFLTNHLSVLMNDNPLNIIKDVVLPGGTSADVPLQKIFMVTTTGDFDGVVGTPIIEYHTSDGVTYSDFMVVTFVVAPEDYVADTYKSAGDIADSNATMTMSNIVLNIPVVPTGATLQHPVTGGTTMAPILPVPVYYRGVEVWTYIFEVTDASAAAYFANTRTETGSEISRQQTTEYGIPVVPTFATPTFVSAIPLWHVNQFSNGVVEGVNGGGPNPAGMRNVINLDRSDAGYSPLWQLQWATELPINYSADEFSNSMQGTPTNGFRFISTPMYVNCPDIGPIGADNTAKAETFMTSIMTDDEMMGETFTVIGSHMSVILTAGQAIMFKADTGDLIGNTTTNMLGGYEYTIMAAELPADASMVMVLLEDGTVIRNITIEDSSSMEGEGDGDGSSSEVDTSTAAPTAVSWTASLLMAALLASLISLV
jgi:hypothetical protein